MSQILNRLKKIAKDNIATILFFIFLFFIGFSIWSNSQQGKTYAIELLSYTQKTVDSVNQTFTSINKSSNLVLNEPARYDIVISNLQDFSTKLTDYASQVPTKNTDQEGITLQNSLKDFLLTIKKSTIEPLLARVQAQKPLIEDLKNYGKLQLAVKKDTKQSILNAINAGTRLNASYNSIYSNIQDEKAKSAKLDIYKDDQKRLDKATEKLNTIKFGLSQGDRDELVGIFDGNWPIEDPLFPTISMTELKTAQFTKDVNTLQKYVNDLALHYSIK